MTNNTVRLIRLAAGLPTAAAGAAGVALGVCALTVTNDYAFGLGVLTVGAALTAAARLALRGQLPTGLFAVPGDDDDGDVFGDAGFAPEVNPTTGSMMLHGQGGLDATGHFYGQIVAHEPPPRP